MKRFENWPTLLAEFLASREGQEFVWGESDCMLLCADAVLALTGEDLASELRGTYTDEAGAAAIISTFGSSVEDILDAKLGSRKEVGFAGRGDIVTFERDGRICGGVVDDTGRRAVMFVEGSGIAHIPLRLCQNAWGY